MRSDTSNPLFRLGRWRVDCAAGSIDDGVVQSRLEPRLIRILQLLAASEGEVISRQALFDGVWPNQDITDQTLDSNMSRLRQKLGDDPKSPSFILTIPKKGYRLLTQVDWDAPSSAAESAPKIETGRSPSARRKPVGHAWQLGFLGLCAVLFGFALTRWISLDETALELKQSATASIAVLPFVNMSADPDTGHFSDGIAEELLNQLTRVKGLHVASRTSSFRFRSDQQALDIREIAQQLNVRYIIEGSVRRDGQELRVTAQLIDANSGYHLWSHTYQRRWSDIFSVQESITQAVVNQIQPQLLAATQPSTDPALTAQSARAYELYLLGRHYWHQRQPESLAQATEYFQQALKLEPQFALAQTGLAECYLAMVPYANLSQAAAIEQAEPWLAKALTLAPDLAETHLAWGHLHVLKTEWVQAESELRKALAINPNLASAQMFLGNVYNDTGRLDLAYGSYRKALALDPLHATILMNLSQSALKLGLYERAAQYLARARALFPAHRYLYGLEVHLAIASGNPLSGRHLAQRTHAAGAASSAADSLACGMLELYLGDALTARTCLQAALEMTGGKGNATLEGLMIQTHLALADSDLGRLDRSQVHIQLAVNSVQALSEEDNANPFLYYEFAAAYSLAGNTDAALHAMAQSIELGGRDYGWIVHDRRLDPLRRNPEFQATIAKIESRQLQMRQRVQGRYPNPGIALPK